MKRNVLHEIQVPASELTEPGHLGRYLAPALAIDGTLVQGYLISASARTEPDQIAVTLATGKDGAGMSTAVLSTVRPDFERPGGSRAHVVTLTWTIVEIR